MATNKTNRSDLWSVPEAAEPEALSCTHCECQVWEPLLDDANYCACGHHKSKHQPDETLLELTDRMIARHVQPSAIAAGAAVPAELPKAVELRQLIELCEQHTDGVHLGMVRLADYAAHAVLGHRRDEIVGKLDALLQTSPFHHLQAGEHVVDCLKGCGRQVVSTDARSLCKWCCMELVRQMSLDDVIEMQRQMDKAFRSAEVAGKARAAKAAKAGREVGYGC